MGDATPIPVELGNVPDRRFPPAVERTAFLVVAEAIDAAHAAAAGHIAVGVAEHDGLVEVEVEGTSTGPSLHLEDRVGALGGWIRIDEGRLRAEIPCA